MIIIKKQRLARTQVEQWVIDYWINEGSIISGLQRKDKYHHLPDGDEYNWREDTEIEAWAKEILEDDTKLLRECFGDDNFHDIELFDARVPRQATEEEIIEVATYEVDHSNISPEQREAWIHDEKLELEDAHIVVYEYFESYEYQGKLLVVIPNNIASKFIVSPIPEPIVYIWEEDGMHKVPYRKYQGK